jgi:23S rRNA U2552 (ribose-2'-O)-methylase RlmE/FtsJ
VLSEFFKQTYNDNNTKASGVEIIERAGYKLIIINEKEEVFLSTEREGKIDRVIELISSNTTVSIKRKKKHFDLGKKGFFKGFNS